MNENTEIKEIIRKFFACEISIVKNNQKYLLGKEIKAKIFDPYNFTFCGKTLKINKDSKIINYDYYDSKIFTEFNLKNIINEYTNALGYKAIFKPCLTESQKTQEITKQLIGGKSFREIESKFNVNKDLIKKIKDTIEPNKLKIETYKRRILKTIDLITEGVSIGVIANKTKIEKNTIERIKEDLN